ncbi:MAG: hypothetical protein Q7R87_01205 [Nanoarchaeota archaeon]|nr:hypothetical protein [Nanoarchaeota archaeon]
MVVEIAQNVSNLPGVIGSIGEIALWLQAVGVVVILWIIFEAFALYYATKRMKEVHIIKKDMARIEGKIDIILKRKK